MQLKDLEIIKRVAWAGFRRSGSFLLLNGINEGGLKKRKRRNAFIAALSSNYNHMNNIRFSGEISICWLSIADQVGSSFSKRYRTVTFYCPVPAYYNPMNNFNLICGFSYRVMINFKSWYKCEGIRWPLQEQNDLIVKGICFNVYFNILIYIW